MALTKKQQKQYLKNSGFCPFCKSKDIQGEDINADGNTMSQEIRCNNCDKSWQDIYTLTNVLDYDFS